MLTFTTSWDDGSVLDLKVAELLNARRMRGTFYVPREFSNTGGKYAAYGRRLSEEEIRSLVRMQEVGGHGLTHRTLTELPSGEAREEIIGSKRWLEETLGVSARMFCYPNGRFDEGIKRAVQEAGYTGARITRKLSFTLPEEKYLMPVSLLISPYPFRRTDASHIYWRRALDPLRGYGSAYLSYPELWRFSWQSMARALFKRAYAKGNYFHLYGHSWELERYGMWGELSSFLDFVHTQKNVQYFTNSEVAAHIVRHG